MKNHSVEKWTGSEEVFIGRERETSDFMESLDHILGKKTSLLQSLLPFLKKKPAATERPRPRLFLYYGEGGFGKSHMLQKCLELAEERRFKTILLDWDEYYARRSSLPNTSGKMITALFTVLTEPEHGIAHFFDEYLRIEKKLEDIADKVERAWKDDASGLIKPLVKLGSTATGLPIPDFAQDFAANTLNELAKGSRRMIIDHLRDSKKMKREDLDLYENNEKALTEALVNGLAAASQLHPIVLAIDTYEQVDRGADTDDWMRNVFLDLVIKKAPKVCVVLAGRNNHFQEYRNRLPDWSLYNRNFDDILLTDDEIRAFAEKYEVSLVGEEALLIRAGTAGIPLVVKDVLRLIREGKDKNQVLKDLDNHAGTVESIITDMVDRFLKYTEEGEWKADRLRCYQMVMLRQFDPDLLREAWGLNPTAFAEMMKILTSRHSFLNPRTHQIHDKVKQFLQKYLISQYRQQTAERPQLQELAEQLLKTANNKLATLETTLPGIEQRYADNRYVGALFDMLLCRIWADGSQLKAIIPGYLIELLAFAPEIAKGFALELEALAPLFPTSQTAAIKTIYQGIHTFEPLTFESSTRIPLRPESKFFEYLEKELKGSSEYRCALLDYLYGAHLVRQKDYDKAFERLQKAVPMLRGELNEQLGEVYFRLGYALPETQSDKVVLAYLLSLELGPDIAAYNNLGIALGEQGKPAEAIEAFRKAIEIQPDYISAHDNLGVALQQQGKLAEAIEAFRKAIDIQPDFVRAHYGLGNVLNEQGKLEEAIKAFRKAIDIQPDFVRAHYGLGNALNEQGKLEEAIEAYRKVIEIKPDFVRAHNGLGNALNEQGKLEEAIEAYRKAIEIQPDYAYAHNCLGNALNEQGKLEEAIEAYRKAIEIQPDYAYAHNCLGNALNEQSKSEEAIEAFRKAIEIQPDYVHAHHGLGIALNEQGKLEESIEAYRKAIEIQPAYVHAHHGLGIALRKQGKLEEAIEAYRKAIEIQPHYAYAHNCLGIALNEQGKLEEAIEAYRKAIDIQPDFSDSWHALGWTYLLLHDLSNAETALQKSSELSEELSELKNAYVPMNLGHLKLFQGEKKQAIALYKSSLVLYEIEEEFFKGMQSDYIDLQMEAHGITPESYEAILQQLKDEAGIVPEA